MIFIDNLIYNTLLSRKAVYMPKAGTLSLAYSGARRSGSRRVVPPKTAIVFSWRRIGSAVNIVDLIVAQGEYRQAEAENYYFRWLDGARTDGRMTIDGVGVYEDKVFTPDKDLIAFLNSPQVNTHPERRGNCRWWWIVALIVAAALLALAMLFCSGVLRCSHPTAVVQSGAATTVVAAAAQDSSATDSTKHVAATAPVASATQPTPQTTVPATSAPKALAMIRSLSGAAESVRKSLAGAATKDGHAADSAATVTPDTTGKTDAATGATSLASASGKTYKYYVVIGVFVDRSNVNGCVKRLKKSHPGLDVQTHRFNYDLTAVTIFGSDSKAESVSMCKHSLGINPEAWVWERK
jgi:hypothetical protein